jgi:hypothetical protein
MAFQSDLTAAWDAIDDLNLVFVRPHWKLMLRNKFMMKFSTCHYTFELVHHLVIFFICASNQIFHCFLT